MWQVKVVLYMKSDAYLLQYDVEFFSEWEMFQTKVVEKIKTHVLCSKMSLFLKKIVLFMR